MNIWLISVGEPLPCDPGKTRLYRTGMLANQLVQDGHDVIWWTSDFNHTAKEYRHHEDNIVKLSDNYKIILLHANSYKRNISIRRILNHIRIAKRLRDKICPYEKPDIIIASYPTIELCVEAVNYGKRNNVPVVIDIRDLWPDSFSSTVPAYSRIIAKLFIWMLTLKKNYIFRNTDVIIGISSRYLEWGLSSGKREKSLLDNIYYLGYRGTERGEISKQLTEEIRNRFKLGKNDMVLIFVGTFGFTYNLSTVIESARRLEGTANIKFLFCGTGESEEKWRKESSGLSNVFFTGWVDSTTLKHLLLIADVGLASYAKGAPQGLPNKIFEYMSSGLPLISSLDGEARDLIEQHKCGYYYDSNSALELKNKIEGLLNREKRDELARNSIDAFNKYYQSTAIYKDYVEHLGKIIKSYGK